MTDKQPEALKAVRVDGWVSRAPDEGMAKRQRKRT